MVLNATAAPVGSTFSMESCFVLDGAADCACHRFMSRYWRVIDCNDCSVLFGCLSLQIMTFQTMCETTLTARGPVVGSLRKWCGFSGRGYLATILANDFFPAGLSLAGVFGLRETAHEWPG